MKEKQFYAVLTLTGESFIITFKKDSETEFALNLINDAFLTRTILGENELVKRLLTGITDGIERVKTVLDLAKVSYEIYTDWLNEDDSLKPEYESLNVEPYYI